MKSRVDLGQIERGVQLAAALVDRIRALEDADHIPSDIRLLLSVRAQVLWLPKSSSLLH